ncbi:hypothetical protein ACLI09_16540 [Flavobacterium sp. RHBU_24]|uniref:hypothetical protein n=1 Tax=Flavobacterium sp. RHBU_24 TaxID=3391185 RepID=UPI003984E6A2
MKKYLLLFPEIFFTALGTYWAYKNLTVNQSVNYIALLVIAIMVFQIIFSKRGLGLMMGALLTLFSFYMMLAAVSDYRDFPEGDSAGTRFLLLALGFFLLSALIGAGMVVKFGRQKNTPGAASETITV